MLERCLFSVVVRRKKHSAGIRLLRKATETGLAIIAAENHWHIKIRSHVILLQR